MRFQKHILRWIGWLTAQPENFRLGMLTATCGLIGGLVGVGFMLGSHWLYAATYLRFAAWGTVRFLVWSFLTITVTSLAAGLLMHRVSRDAAGSGIPQLKVAYWKDLGFVPWRAVWVKFVAGILSIGGGTSLGREGPTVFVAGGLASTLSGWLGVPKQSRRLPVAAGAAAGLAAAFNTPLAAITFVLEELIGDLGNRVLGSVVLASVMGAFVVYGCVGKQPAFELPAGDFPAWPVYLMVPVVAAVASGLAVLFQSGAIGLRGRVRQSGWIPGWLGPTIGAWTTWAIAATVFVWSGHLGVFGLGYRDLSQGITGLLDWRLAGVLVAGKLLASIVSYGWGGCGGIFAPSLFMGGLTGVFVGGLMGNWMVLQPSDHVVLAAVGMSAAFGTLVRAPLTALLIVFEMTHQFSMVPALMLAMLVSQGIARAAGKHNFYDTLLLQDGHELIRVKPPRDFHSWQNLPVSSIARSTPVLLRGMSPPELTDMLRRHPYHCFPVELDGTLRGVVTRNAMEEALRRHSVPPLEPLAHCHEGDTLKTVEQRFLQSTTGLLVVLGADGTPQSILTLHDLLRAQAAATE